MQKSPGHFHQINIPLDVIRIAIQANKMNTLKVFATAKMVSPGRFLLNSYHYQQLCQLSGLKHRTIQSHLKTLISWKWVSFDPVAKMYYLRSWSWFKENDKINSRSVLPIKTDQLPNFQQYVSAGIISENLFLQNNVIQTNRSQTSSNKRLNKVSSISVVNKRETTAQEIFVPEFGRNIPATYTGLSVFKIAALLNMAKSRASIIKNEAAKLGYLSLQHRFKLIAEFNQPFPNFIAHYRNTTGSDEPLRVNTYIRNKKKVFQLLVQLHDQITPLIKLKKVAYSRQLTQKLRKRHQNRSLSFSPSPAAL
jgi:hypothetical protein